jgi:sulfate transport system ATP-binding protein
MAAFLLAYEPAKRLARLNIDLNNNLVGVRVLYEIIDSPPGEPNDDNLPALKLTESRVEFDHVNFAYRAAAPVLQNMNLVAQPGQVTALVGPSGGGKSTVLNLLLRFYDVGSGRVLIDGQNVAAVSRSSLRHQIAYVGQIVHLFRGTVRENIALGKLDANDTEIVAAAKAAHAHDFIMGFPQGYETQVGEHGMQLSGGQRQRMALARALAVDPQVLLLDEPFGALDAKVREDLRAWLRRLHDEVHVTTVLVTHDQAEALDVADRIAVLRDGRIEQVGSPTAVYDTPANAFVMSFLGAVSSLNGALVRPHDIRVGRRPDMAIAAGDGTAESTGVVRAVIDRIVMLGFEVRVELTSAATGRPFTAQITRGDAEALGLAEGDTVYVRATRVPSIADGAAVSQPAPISSERGR